MNVYFTIGQERQETCAIMGVDEDQLRWLEILARNIPQSSVLPEQPSISENMVHFGLYTYPQFRAFMEDIGYLKEISHADTLYRHAQLVAVI
jgi:hypothetical protein